MSHHAYSTLRFNSWKDYKQFTGELSDNWAFRGQLNDQWDLRNAIERSDFIQLHKTIEAGFVAEFQRGARNYLQKDDLPEHLIEWLALMQHHGAPTRLLDFTKSPFIAAYFAFEQCYLYEHSFTAIWAINVQFLKTKAFEALKDEFGEEFQKSNNLITEDLFEKIFHQNDKSIIFPVEPFRMNRRYSLQQSIFVSTGISSVPFMNQLDFLGSEISKAVIKIELPAVLHKEVLRDLQRMNLNRASLFPDLDGYAASLRLRYNSLKTAEENILKQLQMLDGEQFDFFP